MRPISTAYAPISAPSRRGLDATGSRRGPDRLANGRDLAGGGTAREDRRRPRGPVSDGRRLHGGQGTLVDAILSAAGFANAADRRRIFAPVSIERMALFPPVRFVLGFFDQARGDWRGAGRHPVVRKAARGSGGRAVARRGPDLSRLVRGRRRGDAEGWAA
jgi:iron complex transport system substrate-binding protein